MPSIEEVEALSMLEKTRERELPLVEPSGIGRVSKVSSVSSLLLFNSEYVDILSLK